MFGSLGGPELLLILVLALLLFGPRKLPEIGRTLGRGLSEFRKATSDFKQNLQREVDLEQVRDAGRGLKEATREIGESISAGGSPAARDAAPARGAPGDAAGGSSGGSSARPDGETPEP